MFLHLLRTQNISKRSQRETEKEAKFRCDILFISCEVLRNKIKPNSQPHDGKNLSYFKSYQRVFQLFIATVDWQSSWIKSFTLFSSFILIFSLFMDYQKKADEIKMRHFFFKTRPLQWYAQKSSGAFSLAYGSFPFFI
jgi:hypothetical protein